MISNTWSYVGYVRKYENIRGIFQEYSWENILKIFWESNGIFLRSSWWSSEGRWGCGKYKLARSKFILRSKRAPPLSPWPWGTPRGRPQRLESRAIAFIAKGALEWELGGICERECLIDICRGLHEVIEVYITFHRDLNWNGGLYIMFCTSL